MNNNVKLTVSIASILVAAGLVLMGVAFMLSGGDITKLNTQNLTYTEKRAEFDASKFSLMSLKDSNNSVKLLPSPDNKIYITYYESEKTHYAFDQSQAGALKITYVSDFHWFDLVGITFLSTDTTVVIEIPQNTDMELDIKTSNGGISVNDLTMKKPLSFKSSNGKITLANISTDDKIYAKTSNSKITFSEVSCGGGELETSDGKIELVNASFYGDVNGKTSNGNILLTDVSCMDRIEMRTSNSPIEFSNLDCGYTDLETSNGRISGTVAGKHGDYNFTTKTSNGNISVPDSEPGGKTFIAKTSNSKITIEYATAF